ncbi:hypothetical protein [Gordonibacter sp.]|uniref:hypothetical protein n=1 Tax=Gordonibacter sp. TaxID=1968902 RepID=UPI002FC8A5C7
MIDQMTQERLNTLRAPFPDDAVSLKPVYTGSYEYGAEYDGGGRIPESAWGKCDVCGRYHALPAKHLRYVGHARITERLNDIDPEWDWRPLAVDSDGVPIIRGGSMWIELTVLGITRKGVGDAGSKIGTNATKEIVGDAIRNAAMRFGCGLEMWFEQDDDDAYAPLQEPKESDSKAPFLLVVRPNATKAQKRLADVLAALSDGDAIDAAHSIYSEFGRHYYELNQREVDAALEFLDELHAEDPDDCEVIKI